jgi:TetR/AcrR family transcriptional repressor of nem operon
MGVDDADADAAASSLLSELVGALSLARAEPDPAASDAILERSKAALKRRFGLETRSAA